MNLEETAAAIESMEIRGAGRMARSAASALKVFTLDHPGDDMDDFRAAVENAAQRLIATRPTAISLSNAVRMTLLGIDEQDDVESARKIIADNADRFVENSRSAVRRIGDLAPPLLESPSVVMTICNSSAAISAIVHCHREGKVKRVYACETRPRRQGLITVAELAGAGVPVTLIVDSAMRYVMPNVDVVFMGSDTIETDGSVLNKIGTAMLAAIAGEFRVPVYACAETYKFLPKSRAGEMVVIEERAAEEITGDEELPDGVDVFNPVFERVSPRLVTGIITEEGVVEPSDASRVINEYLGNI